MGILRRVRYPHGLRFAAGDERLLVADAGAPHVHVFAASEREAGTAPRILRRPSRSWTTRRSSRGHHTPQEGGPKGIELDPRTNILLVTSEETPLSCFDAGAIVERPWEIGRDEDALVGYELHALGTAAKHKAGSHLAAELAATAESADGLAAELAAIRATKTWRLTEPARDAYGAIRRLVGGRR